VYTTDLWNNLLSGTLKGKINNLKTFGGENRNHLAMSEGGELQS